jgi:O-6-methylguanine DNA methyltransferase
MTNTDDTYGDAHDTPGGADASEDDDTYDLYDVSQVYDENGNYDQDAYDDATLAIGLAALVEGGPPGLLERIVAHWVRVPGPVVDLFVASTDLGIAYVRSTVAVHDNPREFADLFHRRFAKPLLPARRSPKDLLALRSYDTAKLRFDLSKLSDFEREVLLAVMTIPRGQVRPHAWIAHQIGQPAQARAVGSALVDNPVPVLIPCHRVIQSDGSLGDHVLGPLTKRALLDAEGANVGEVYELGMRHIHYLGSDTTGIVCFPTCPNARRTAATHRHGFGSVAEAESAGYRPCPQCRPVAGEVA